MNHRTRDIDAGERSGVLAPSNLARFSARWVSPAIEVRDVVDTYWSVSWHLPPGEEVQQRIVDFPAITFSIEEGDVSGSFVATTVRPQAWSRTIRGQGCVFAIRLRPAGLAVLSDLCPTVLEHEQEITAQLDARAHRLLRTIASAPTPTERACQADELVLSLLRERPTTRAHLLANAALDALTSSPRVRSGKAVAEALGTSERTLQRALRATVGLGPNEVARRIRLQEVIRLLSAPGADVATTAAELGYVDQAHLINEFRAVSGMTPGRYVREQGAAWGDLMGPENTS